MLCYVMLYCTILHVHVCVCILYSPLRVLFPSLPFSFLLCFCFIICSRFSFRFVFFVLRWMGFFFVGVWFTFLFSVSQILSPPSLIPAQASQKNVIADLYFFVFIFIILDYFALNFNLFLFITFYNTYIIDQTFIIGQFFFIFKH